MGSRPWAHQMHIPNLTDSFTGSPRPRVTPEIVLQLFGERKPFETAALQDSSPSICNAFRAQTTFTCTTVSINPHTTLWRLARWRNKFRKVKYQRSSDLSTASVAEAALAKSDGQTHKSNHHLVTHHGSLSSSIPQNRQKTLVRSKGVHFSCWWLLPDLPIRKQYHKTGLNFYQISQATYLNNKHLKSSSQSFSRTKAVGLV